MGADGIQVQHSRTLAIIVPVAVLATIGALWIRHRIVSSAGFIVARAVKDPRFKNLDAQAAKLQADVQASPNSVQPRWKLADMYQKLHLLDLARQQIEQITRLSPGDATPALALANVDLALLHDNVAEQEFRAATRRWPGIVAGWQGLAAVLYREQHYTECLEATGKALDLDPKSRSTRFILASALLQYARQFPSPEMYAPYARVARKELEDLLPTWPEPSEIHYRLGSAYSILRKTDKAIEHFSKAVQLRPRSPHFVVSLVDAYLAINKRDEAKRVLASARAHNVQSPLLLDREGQIAQATATPEGWNEAIRAFSEALRMDPDIEAFHEHLGSAYVRAGKLDLARQEFERAAILNPERPFPYQQLSAIYTRLGDSQRATAAAKMATRMVFNEQQLHHFEQLSTAYPDDVKLHLVIADRYRDLKMISAARDKYRMVLRIDPGNEHAQREIAKLDSNRKATVTGG
jgi:tetratricopeptide (TPR) repeat protein